VKANIERDKAGPSSYLLTSIQSVNVVDDSHVTLLLSRPDPSLLDSFSLDRPGMMVSPAAFNNPDLSTNPVGAGPYKATSAQIGGNAVYERWDGYWDKSFKGAKRIMLDFVADNTARYNGLRSGDYDASFLASPLDIPTSIKQLGKGYHAV